MTWYILAGIFGAALVAALVIHKIQQTVHSWIIGRHGYRPKTLLTANEVDFYHRLTRALGPRWVVLPQVSMGALMDTTLLPAHPDYWRVRQSFAAKICDFVVCDPKSLKPQLIVELDDRMHDFSRDKTRDGLVAKAGYRTVRFWSRAKPDDATLKRKLGAALALN